MTREGEVEDALGAPAEPRLICFRLGRSTKGIFDLALPFKTSFQTKPSSTEPQLAGDESGRTTVRFVELFKDKSMAGPVGLPSGSTHWTVGRSIDLGLDAMT